MKPKNSSRVLTFLLLVLAASLLGTTPLLADHEENVSRTFAGRSGMTVELENLAGAINVSGTSGSEIVIEATIVAENAALAKKLNLRFEERGDRLVVTAGYPTNEITHYSYPGAGKSSSFMGFGSSTSTRYQGERVKIDSRGELLYVDFEIQLPAGVGADIDNKVGNIKAHGVDGPFSADTGSGKVLAENGTGRLEADTGSGDVIIRNHRGEVEADTGSGEIELYDIEGDVEADTGSGDVLLEDVHGETILVDTGSGDIEMRNVSGEIDADTGSGSVEGRALRTFGDLVADTGSGNVDLEGDFTGVRNIEIDTGSGNVTLEGSFPGMDLTVSTGSGGVDVDLPGLDIQRKAKDFLKARVGGGGAEVSIETGSGRVRISG